MLQKCKVLTVTQKKNPVRYDYHLGHVDLRPIYTLRFVVPICRPREIVKQIGTCNVPFVLVFEFGNSFVKKAGIFQPL